MWFVNRTYRYIRAFLFRVVNRQFLIFLFFLALSAAFWLFQTLEESYEEEFAVPLRLTNIPENVVITTDLPQQLHIMLKDRGAALLQYQYARKFSPVSVDFEDYANGRGHVRLLTNDVMKQVYAQLSPNTRVGNVRPDTLEYYFNYGEKKRVPVRVYGGIQTDAHYYLSSMRIVPDSVTVYAASEFLDTITAAYTRPVRLEGVSDTVSLTEELAHVRGAKFDPRQVKIYLSVDQLTEKTVQVPVRGVNFPATKALRTFPSKVNVTFQVGMGMYKRITEDNLVLVINYEELLENKTGKCRLSLRTIPSGVSHVRIYPQEVDFLIEDVVSEN